jgi:cytidine deaminase
VIESSSVRLSVTLIDVTAGREPDFRSLADQFAAVVNRKGFGRAEFIRDEAFPTRFYAVRHWVDASAAERCHADADVRDITAQIYQIARVSHLVNGARRPNPMRLTLDDRRMKMESDRRTGFERRVQDKGHPEGDRRLGNDRRVGPRRLREGSETDLIGAARRARTHADAAFSKFKVGAALQTADGAIVTGCNIENATFGLSVCAERVAMFKALSDGHRAFTKIAIVADTDAPTPPCGACRQVLWEFGGNLEVVLGNLKEQKSSHRLQDLFPLPFDARNL